MNDSYDHPHDSLWHDRSDSTAVASAGGKPTALESPYSYPNAGSCPDCGAGMVRLGSCLTCPLCGFGACG